VTGVLDGEIGPSSTFYKTDMSAWGWNASYRLIYALKNYLGSTDAETLIANGALAMEAFLNEIIGSTAGTPYGVAATMVDRGRRMAELLVSGIATGLTPSSWPTSLSGMLNTAVKALVDYITARVNAALGIASPSQVMADLALNIPAGLAQGMLAGLPGVAQAANALALAAAPELSGLFGRDTFVTAERRIYVEIGGNAGGGAPLDAAQFDLLRRELIYAIRRGA